MRGSIWCALALLAGCSDAASPPSPIDSSGSSSTPFDLTGAMSSGNISVALFFDAAVDTTSAGNAGNYTITGLAVTSVSVVSGEVVTLETGPQSLITYSVSVAGVKRASDGASLATHTTTFVGHSAIR